MTLEPISNQSSLNRELVTLINQLNIWRKKINEWSALTDSDILVLEANTADVILNKAVVALVNGDYDLTYSEDGEIITDG
jgi:hypothetical protein